MTQKENILRYLNGLGEWVFNYQLLSKKTKYGWLGSQADRRARELCGEVGDRPSFEYEGEYRGIRYLIRGRLIQRCRQYYVKILDCNAREGRDKKTNLTPRRIPTPGCLKGRAGKGKVFKEWNSHPRFLEGKFKNLDIALFSWHSLRHRRASLWANSGMTTFEIMVRLGHNNLETTMKYLRLLGFTRL